MVQPPGLYGSMDYNSFFLRNHAGSRGSGGNQSTGYVPVPHLIKINAPFMKRNMLTLLLALFETGAAFSAPLSGIAVTPEPTLHSGFYRFAIQRQDGKEIAFISEVKDSGGKKIVYIINGKDKLSADEISFHKDSITIKLPFFGSSLIAKI